MQLCPQYVPVEMLCFSVSIHGRGHQLDSTKSDFHPTSALCHDLIFHSIWSLAHWSLVVLWITVSSGRFIGLLARNLALLRLLLTVRLLMRPLTIHLLRSVFAVLNGCCLASLLKSLFSLRVVFKGFPVLWRYFTLPVWFTRCFNRTMTEWFTLNPSPAVSL